MFILRIKLFFQWSFIYIEVNSYIYTYFVVSLCAMCLNRQNVGLYATYDRDKFDFMDKFLLKNEIDNNHMSWS